ncbi:phosphatases II [Hesseltinella vesiculosa]|uniref:protein-tyrosine-phosphatase n=1 Tax=Hesseltinella vesiculosa TaxID=101127 RepID=A0A1X2GLP6_9FUNG|nr:phosphatases II [Hesseltinella vesiculosa]
MSNASSLTSTLNERYSSSTTAIHAFVPPSTPFTQSHNVSKYPDGPVQILPNVYLGDEHNSQDLAHLKDLAVHCMMNVATEVNHPMQHMFAPWDPRLFDDDEPAKSQQPCPTLSTSSSSTSSTKSYHTTQSGSSGMTLAVPTLTKTTPSLASSDCLTASLPSPLYYKKRSWHHHIQDNDQAVHQELHGAVLDITHAIQAGKRVLVHCQCGLARSATVLVAYVMYTKNLSMQVALAFVKQRAPHINPNFSLMYHLREYEAFLRPVAQTPRTLPPPALPATPTTASSKNTIASSTSSSLAAKWKSFKAKSSASPLRPSWWRNSTTPISSRKPPHS